MIYYALAALFSLTFVSCSLADSDEKKKSGKSAQKQEKDPKSAKAPASRDVNVADARKLYDEAKAGKTKLIVLDIRTAQEFKGGHIKGAVNIDYLEPKADFRAALKKLDLDTKYLMHCQSGGRSSDAMEIMKELGFKNVYHLKAGYRGWKKAGHETVKD